MIEGEPTHEILWWNAAKKIAGSYEGAMFEARFESALDALIERKQIFSWDKTRRGTPEDGMGVDYIIEINGIFIPWQVTSTDSEGRKHRKNFSKGTEELRDTPITTIRSKEYHMMRSVSSLEEEILFKADEYIRQKQSCYMEEI